MGPLQMLWDTGCLKIELTLRWTKLGLFQEQFWGLVHGIWPRLKRDRRRDGRSLFRPPGQLAKREQPGTGNDEERRRPFETREDYWEAPNHLFWICGDTAYTKLPGDWSGSCTIGIIKPAFFLLPKRLGAHLRVPVYDNLGKVKRKKRDTLTIGGDQKWKGKIRTPEEIIKTYGPATWAQDGSWGYHTPIYMLNRIIRLQAVLEMVSNQTALALDHNSDQLTQTRAVIYQIRLAVDYLLTDGGGICGKFNSSECCSEIDDKSAVIKNISKEIRKLAYVGNQEWTPLMNTNWWNSFWSFKGGLVEESWVYDHLLTHWVNVFTLSNPISNSNYYLHSPSQYPDP
ncbi:hypothetical protein DUI87_34208 [Hirundo rustica rustica]|uniref:ENR1 protein n=1 Tax=Hirundo rustica rustica TaxID=333673 RepID=A0A3M0IK78_HIRRU|nr:hypothetical protein DUI87_34208 [Hirundo rustica rustica]